MKTMALLTALTLLSGCHSIKIGDATVRSFGQRTTIKELSMSPDGTLRVKGYNNNQVDGMVELFNTGMQVGKTLAK